MSMNNYPACGQDEDPFADFDPGPEEPQTFESDSLALAGEVYRYCRRVIAQIRAGNPVAADISDMRRLEELAEAVLIWDEDDDPHSMGWVDDRGRP